MAGAAFDFLDFGVSYPYRYPLLPGRLERRRRNGKTTLGILPLKYL